MHSSNQIPVNPFLKLRFFEFAAVSTLTIAFFPISLLVCRIAFGPLVTRQLIQALINDLLQTILIAGCVILALVAALSYGIWQWIVV